jgi:pyrroline-5-carboxylate reductase
MLQLCSPFRQNEMKMEAMMRRSMSTLRNSGPQTLTSETQADRKRRIEGLKQAWDRLQATGEGSFSKGMLHPASQMQSEIKLQAMMQRSMPPLGSSGPQTITVAPLEEATVGFIGIGTINSAVCRGLLNSANSPAKVIIGPRNAEKAAALAAEYPEKVTVAESNQEVVDSSDWIFLATPPKKDSMQETLGPLRFRKEQPILSFIAGAEREELEKLVSPAIDIVQALPLPPAEFAESTTVMYPPNERMEQCLSNIGRVVAVESREQAMAIGSMACIMGDFYAHLRSCHQWLVSKGVDAADASRAVGSYFSTYHHASQHSEIGFDHLVAEQTPGGVNQQVIEQLEKQGRYDMVKEGLETAFKRLCPTAVQSVHVGKVPEEFQAFNNFFVVQEASDSDSDSESSVNYRPKKLTVRDSQ